MCWACRYIGQALNHLKQQYCETDIVFNGYCTMKILNCCNQPSLPIQALCS